MNQNYIIINEDKKEYIHPHIFDDSVKFEGFGYGYNSTLTALSLLLTQKENNGRGGGDWGVAGGDIMGRWSRNKIRMIGDQKSKNLFDEVLKKWKNISSEVLEVLIQDEWIKERQKRGIISIEERLNS
jgi:hypothetical protein